MPVRDACSAWTVVDRLAPQGGDSHDDPRRIGRLTGTDVCPDGMTTSMTIKYETWTPQHRQSDIGSDELNSTYERARATDSPTFTWNDLGDDVLIVSVGDDYSVVSMLTQATWFFLRGSE